MGCVQPSGDSEAARRKKQEIEKMRRELERRNKEIALLEKQNTDLKVKKQQQITEITRQIRQNDIQIIQFQQDGQADSNNNDQTQVGSLLRCTICEEDYNLTDRVPWMVCVNQHTYCSLCINGLMKRNRNQCPECRKNITAGNKNLHLCLLLQNINSNTTKLLSSSNNLPAKQFNITLSNSNRYYDKFKFYPPNTLIKGAQCSWHGLLFNQVIPAEGKFKFCIDVVFSLHNNIEIGIIDMSSKVQKGKMSNKRISYHLIDGKIMDSGNIDVPITMWRSIGKAASKGASKVIVQVNMDDNKIKWIVNDEVVGETVITNYLKYAKAVPYLSMYHAEDVVNLNAW